MTEKNNELVRQWTIPVDQLSIRQQQSSDMYRYELNSTQLDLNFHSHHILRLHLTIIDQNDNQLAMTQPAIHCTLTRKSGRTMQISLLIDRLIF